MLAELTSPTQTYGYEMMKRLLMCLLFVFSLFYQSSLSFGQDKVASLFVEAESFEQHGGWSLDTQFIRHMGSPYLLAHGLGKPVADATATVAFSETGTYRVFVRTKDWVARWKAPGQPGKFQVIVNGLPLKETFGTKGAEWNWQDGGSVEIKDKSATVALHDLTGFDGRCDAIVFTKGTEPPPNSSDILPAWRRTLLGLQEKPTVKSGYDLVVVGGGYSGMGAAISAARMGCKVALIQDRPVVGGNGSSEVRVWAMGLIRRGKYPRIGEIVEEFADRAKKSPGTFEEFGDAQKEALVRSESNIDLFLNQHAFQVDMDQSRISAVYAFDTKTSEHTKFTGKLFCDATGHGTLGDLAHAEWTMAEKGRMGMSNMWAWDEADTGVEFPKTPWALDLNMSDFPYPVDHHGQWFWESGFDKDAIGDAEGIRDWNLRAVFGAFNAMKNGSQTSRNRGCFRSDDDQHGSCSRPCRRRGPVRVGIVSEKVHSQYKYHSTLARRQYDRHCRDGVDHWTHFIERAQRDTHCVPNCSACLSRSRQWRPTFDGDVCRLGAIRDSLEKRIGAGGIGGCGGGVADRCAQQCLLFASLSTWGIATVATSSMETKDADASVCGKASDLDSACPDHLGRFRYFDAIAIQSSRYRTV